MPDSASFCFNFNILVDSPTVHNGYSHMRNLFQNTFKLQGRRHDHKMIRNDSISILLFLFLFFCIGLSFSLRDYEFEAHGCFATLPLA